MRPQLSLLLLRIFIVTVWLVNGLYCKVLGQIPRHQAIVGEILGYEHGKLLTQLIGISEIGMAIWILSGFAPRLNVFVQVSIIALMNLLEFLLVPDLLLWGRFNSLFAFAFILLILASDYYRTYSVRSHVVS